MRHVSRRAVVARLLPLFVVLSVVQVARPAIAADGTCTGSVTVTCTFSSTGAEQTFTVPSGISSIHVVLTAGSGGAGHAAGGRGGILEADVPVSAGSQLFVEVGGNGSTIAGCCDDPTPGGFNGGGPSHPVGGGSGGGASDIRTVSSTATGSLDSRLVVAGGGGGGGGNVFATFAGNGGDAGQLAGVIGGNGAADTADGTAGGTGGGGGTQSGGGAAGVGQTPVFESGTIGGTGAGGGGGEAIGAAGGGGGGGGGYFGGGGAGGGEATSAGGGGGGGSSFAVSAATVDSFTLDGTHSPSIVISYTVPATIITVNVSGSQTYGGSPSFTEADTAPSGVLSGTVSCAPGTVNGGTAINSTLGAGSYTIDGSTCSGLSASAGYTISYVGATNGFVVSPASIPVTVTGSQTYGSSSPTFNASYTTPGGTTITGTVSCSTVNGGTPITASLTAGGSYTIDGSSCSGLNVSDPTDYTFAYTGGAFTVAPAAQTVSFGTPQPATAYVGGPTYTPSASSTSLLPVAITVDASSASVCSISNIGVVSFQSAGTCLLNATQPGLPNYVPGSAQQSFSVYQQPAFVLANPPLTASVGVAYEYTFAASGSPAPTYALAAGAPSWLSINPTSGMVTGKPPAKTKSFTYSVIATNTVAAVTIGTQTAGPFKVTVTTPPPPSTKADLSVSLSCPTSGKVKVNEACTLTVRNAGPAAAKNVIAALGIPFGFSPVTVTTGGVWHHNVVTWNLATLAANSSATFTVTFKPLTVGKAYIWAAVASSNPDPNFLNNFTITPDTITR